VFYRAGTSVAELIQIAYSVTRQQIIGGPDWIRKEWFEINAKAPAGASDEQIPLMVRSLLEDRFHLSVRREQQDLPFSRLVFAGENGRPGPELQPCSEPQSQPPMKPMNVPPGAVPLIGRCRPISSIAASATVVLGSLVVDETGLSGLWNYGLVYAQLPPLAAGREQDLAARFGAPSFSTALREQLGLKLEATRGAVDVLIVEAVDRPTEN
jgi:uncharacterized protein (TIGR03435 family)